jgi:hypothetical protein
LVFWKIKLTNESLLAQVLSGREVLLPLEERERLVDEREDVHSAALLADNLLLHLNGSLELLNRLLVLLLVEQQFTVVVVDIALVAKVLDATAEGGHGRVEVDGLLVVGSGHGELGKDEVELGAVVEDVRVVGVVLDGKLEVMGGLVTLGCELMLAKACGKRIKNKTYFAQGAC